MYKNVSNIKESKFYDIVRADECNPKEQILQILSGWFMQTLLSGLNFVGLLRCFELQ